MFSYALKIEPEGPNASISKDYLGWIQEKLKQKHPKPQKQHLATPITGSGFVVSPSGHVLTNAHVAVDCTRIELKGKAISGTAFLIASDRRNDLALLKTSGRPAAVV